MQGGGPDWYIAKHNPLCNITGIDFNQDVVLAGNSKLKSLGVSNCRLEYSDMFDLPSKYEHPDGIIMLQTFNILPDFSPACQTVLKLKPEWIAYSVLAYDEPLDYIIKIKDWSKASEKKLYSEVFYNIYSFDSMATTMHECGYEIKAKQKFQMDIDLPQPSVAGRGTYTIRLDTGEREQVSGAMIMPWYFVFANKKFR